MASIPGSRSTSSQPPTGDLPTAHRSFPTRPVWTLSLLLVGAPPLLLHSRGACDSDCSPPYLATLLDDLLFGFVCHRPDMIDAAMLRPGRLDKLLYVPLPVASERLSILSTVLPQPTD